MGGVFLLFYFFLSALFDCSCIVNDTSFMPFDSLDAHSVWLVSNSISNLEGNLFSSRGTSVRTSFCRRNCYVSVINLFVIALQHYRSGLLFIAVQRAAGNSRNLGVVDDRGAV